MHRAKATAATLCPATKGIAGSRSTCRNELAPEIQEAIKKGRRLQDLIKEAGVRYLRAQKRERRSTLQK